MATLRRFAVAVVLAFGLALPVFAAPAPHVTISLDATEAPRKIFHAHLTIPASPGTLTLYYPKWIPGEHGPTGPIQDLAGLKFTANGQVLKWRRDLLDDWTIHVDVPAGATNVEATLDFISPAGHEGIYTGGASATDKMTVISWNTVLLYPAGWSSDQLTYDASLRLPRGWNFGTSLQVASKSESEIKFAPASLTMLVDSPIISGQYLKVVTLNQGENPPVEMDIAADTAAALEAPPEVWEHYKNLVAQAGALFGARHYRDYHFLFSLSDHVAHFGLEHHESNDSRSYERTLVDDRLRLIEAGLLPHEYTHSWNGKYRRPADLTTPDFEQPMQGDLLWVYEGLTEYLGKVLPARRGLWTPENFHESMAAVAAEMENQSGRRWRPLVDTATAVQFTYSSPRAWMNYRRRVDYYFEGLLLWMEADVIIRRQSQGKLSLDDFCHKFHGGQDTGPMVKTYTFDDIVNTLNEVTPYDWRGFLNERVNTIVTHAPLGGITNGGWKLVYNEKPNEEVKFNEQQRKFINSSYSIGLMVSPEGAVLDVNPELPTAKAGLAPGMKIVGVNGRGWSADALHDAIAATKNATAPIELRVENGSFQENYKVAYRGGERYPHLERDATQPNLLDEIIKPHAH